MKVRPRIAIAAGRAAGVLSRALRLGGGTSLPGAIALQVDSRLIKTLAGRLDRGSIIVTATNGKTTTANMAAGIFSAAGLAPVHNAAGANLAYGIATALMRPDRTRGEDQPAVGLFEVDEAVVRNVAEDLSPRVLAVGNIFRDQLDRFGEVDQTARLIADGIDRLAPGATVVLNADDPRVAALGKETGSEKLYFGIDDRRCCQNQGTAEPAGAQDSKDCLVCGQPLDYTLTYFSHLGHYSCPACGFSRPKPEIVATDIELGMNGTRFTLVTPDGSWPVTLGVPALFNVYNALLAAAIAYAAGVDAKSIVSALADFKAAFGRFETLSVEGRRIHLMLIKNPTGFNQAIAALNIDSRPKNVLIAINDNLADGTDVSWLWDADVESLGSTSWLLAGGTRAFDMALRLKYAGLADRGIRVEPDFDSALEAAVKQVEPGGDIYILPTYTAMLDIRRRLIRLGGGTPFWSDVDSREETR